MVTWKSDMSFNEMHTVLIVSQDPEMVGVWETLFEQKDCFVVVENAPENALQSSRLLTPALTVVDLDLSQSERINLCRKLRSTTNGALLLLAPRDSEVEISEYHHAGVDEFLFTPISPMALLIKSMAWLARQEWIVPRKQNTGMCI